MAEDYKALSRALHITFRGYMKFLRNVVEQKFGWSATVGEGVYCFVLRYAGFFAGSLEDGLDTFDRPGVPIIDTLRGIYEAQKALVAIFGDKEFRFVFCCFHAHHPYGYLHPKRA